MRGAGSAGAIFVDEWIQSDESEGNGPDGRRYGDEER